jgi:hypothetical protein
LRAAEEFGAEFLIAGVPMILAHVSEHPATAEHHEDKVVGAIATFRAETTAKRQANMLNTAPEAFTNVALAPNRAGFQKRIGLRGGRTDACGKHENTHCIMKYHPFSE